MKDFLTAMKIVAVGIVVLGLILAFALWQGIIVIEKKTVDLPMELSDEMLAVCKRVTGARDRLVERQRVLVQELERGNEIAASLLPNGSAAASPVVPSGSESTSLRDQFDRISTSLESLLSCAKEERASCPESLARLKAFASEVSAFGDRYECNDLRYLGWCLKEAAEDHEKRVDRLAGEEPRKRIQAALSVIDSATRELEVLSQDSQGHESSQDIAAVQKRYAASAKELEQLTEIYIP